MDSKNIERERRLQMRGIARNRIKKKVRG